VSLVLSLFPGIGLLDMAFEEEGFCVVRGPDVLWGGDIRAFHPPAGVFHGVIGGPPCQSFSSLANLVRAKGHEPRFGNLFPEFARCVVECLPDWFLCENVDTGQSRAAGDEALSALGYSIKPFSFDNSALDSGDGYGEQQERKRRFWFGTSRPPAPDLRRWIKTAALLLPRAGAVTQTHVDNSNDAKGRTPAVRGTPRIREQSVLSSPESVPVALGGSGKRKPGAREKVVVWNPAPGQRSRNVAVTAAHSGAKARPKGGHLIVYRWARMLELQGLSPEFLKDAPFTVEGKRKAVANGVPLPMGRAIARAVKAAVAEAVA
jgi:site-specific DNA-cytosine methylase